jgi:CRISPR/Cas system CSM-associated protein Csm2 small subunit
VLERIATVKEENLKRLDDDIDILKSYLKTQNAPNRQMRRILNQAANAAVKRKGSIFEIVYQRTLDMFTSKAAYASPCRAELRSSPQRPQ